MTTPGFQPNRVGEGPYDARAAAQRGMRTQIEHDASAKVAALGADPTYITNPEHFPGWTHEDLYARAQQLLPGDIEGIAEGWAKSSSVLAEGFTDLHTTVRRVIQEGWEGEAADAAVATTNLFHDSGVKLSEVTTVLQLRLQLAAQAAGVVRSGMPNPALTPLVTMAELAAQPPAVTMVKEQAREAARQEAIRLMDGMYLPSFTDAGTAVPAFTPPPIVNGGGGGFVGSGGGNSGGGSGFAGTSNLYAAASTSPTASDDSSHEYGNPSGTTDTGNTTGARKPAAAYNNQYGNSGANGFTPPQETRAANTTNSGFGGMNTNPVGGGFTSGTTGTGAGYGSGHNSGAGYGSGAGFGSGVGPGHGFTPGNAGGTPGGMGGFTSGTTNGGGTSGTSAAASPAGRPGTPGMAGMGPMGAGAGASKRSVEEEENERDYHPDYLITIGNGKDLFGPLRKVVPPVIGDWNDPNHP